jgi:hypothetical protein
MSARYTVDPTTGTFEVVYGTAVYIEPEDIRAALGRISIDYDALSPADRRTFVELFCQVVALHETIGEDLDEAARRFRDWMMLANAT